ncbi:uncharacterized protein N7487_010673 [Penicillium crustosum]|uniref:uncharacterized protein n=1 Tax=Penicillium crustosum TaxID=36656 RepID=UPI00238235F5|nr:uncharacterized protein N7487_010671 [Penicillium crustosum]XP_056726983.1 uncharacterized protein N7487_010673 [Penicillium crustosum]KAJ5396368.1 hypothetical protein N7487_010671 [Penicillium crustosum]KAJ5396370.1 hypothetical protein N7487_010673 [Penicillium crustosum]
MAYLISLLSSRAKKASLENVGTINISTTAIRRIDNSAPAIIGLTIPKILIYFSRQISKTHSLEAYLTATPYIRPAVPPKLTSSRPSPASLTSTLTPSYNTVPSEPKYRDLLLKPTTARLNRAPLTLTNVHELYRYLYSPEFFNNSVLRATPDKVPPSLQPNPYLQTAISSSSALVALSIPDISLGPSTSYTDKTTDNKPILLANLAALTYARDISLDRLTYPFNLATRHTQIPVNSDRQPLLKIERYFRDALTVRLFYSTKTRTSDSERKLILLESLDKVQAFLGRYPPYQTSSARTATRTTTEIDKNSASTHRAQKATRKETDPIALNLTTAEADVDKDIPDPDDVVTPSVSDEPDSPSSVYTPPTDSVSTPYPPGVDAAVTKLSEL